MSDANARQVGGAHYQSNYQHWDLVLKTGMGYLEGNATKYIARWRKKNGLEDLKKAEHYINKLIEVHGRMQPDRVHLVYGGAPTILREVRAFATANKLDAPEELLIEVLVTWMRIEDLNDARSRLLQIIHMADPDAQEGQSVPASDSNKHADRSEDWCKLTSTDQVSCTYPNCDCS
jgi:hypothetical protein